MERWEKFQGVYVHTPFCLQKCLYCDFPSYAGLPEEVRQRYVDALCREIEVRSLQRELPVAENATVYFGGGTPTVLAVEQIAKVVASLKEYGWWNNPAEATIEANPGTVNAETLKALREIGFDRISLGVQSLQDNELRALGRIHTAEQALYAIEEAKQAGFRRINADLMSGIPCQTAESFRNTMNKILQMNLSHISAYSLILEEGTPLERMVREDKVQLPDEEVSYNMYEMTTDILAKAGLQRYEISNYAAPGEESRHNIVYWHYEPYAAFGAGACSFTGTERRTNTADVLQYIKRTASLSLPALKTDSDLWQTEALDRKTQISEAMIMGLRMTAGVNLQKIQQRFGIDILESYGKEIQTLLDRKMAECEGRTLRLTPYGMRYGNRAFEAFI
jgi:oxygen-independent coproporphyrinogen-3 oxidase